MKEEVKEKFVSDGAYEAGIFRKIYIWRRKRFLRRKAFGRANIKPKHDMRMHYRTAPWIV